MRQKEAPSYSSARVQRATRINSIEAARLQQRLHYIEQAKLHQCRLKNQDIRLISLSIDYIQACSGHSAEAWRPPPPKTLIEEDEDPEEAQDQPPCFLYGERIWERKKRRLQRPLSAFEQSSNHRDNRLADDNEDTASRNSSRFTLERPNSSPGKTSLRSGAKSALGWFRTPTFAYSEAETPNDRLSPESSRSSTPHGRATPHQDWEDDTSDVTKKILKSQAQAQAGYRNSVYQTSADGMTSHSARTVRNLARKIRVSATPTTTHLLDERHQSRPTTPRTQFEKPPRRPGENGQRLSRRASIGEILNQRRPTLNAGQWKSQLSQTTDKPMSMSAHRQMILEAKKEMSESRNEFLREKVKDFIQDSPRPQRVKSAFI